jgi:hypothetical protein
MSFQQLVEIAIGLALVYYILGLIVSIITKGITDSLNTRGRALQEYLEKIVGDDETVQKLLERPQIKSLAPIRYAGRAGLSGLITGTVKSEPYEVGPKPKTSNGSPSGGTELAPKKSKGKIISRIESIPISNLVDAVFDVYDLDDETINKQGAAIKDTLSTLPESWAKEWLTNLVDQNVTNATQLRAKLAMRFNGVMDQAAQLFTTHARRIVIVLSLFVTVLFGVDSIELAHQLSQNADMRAIAGSVAAKYVEEKGSSADVGPLIEDLSKLSLKIGWWAAPANFPQNAALGDIAGWVILKILGLGITAVAVSQGSSFWYDILRKLKGANISPTDEKALSGDQSSKPSRRESETPNDGTSQ